MAIFNCSIGVIEGKAPYVYVSAKVAEIIDKKAQYIKNRGQSDQYYKQMMIDYLKRWGKGKKTDFVKLLSDKLPDVLNAKQKDNKIRYLLNSMRKDGIIEPSSSNKRTANWILTNPD